MESKKYSQKPLYSSLQQLHKLVGCWSTARRGAVILQWVLGCLQVFHTDRFLKGVSRHWKAGELRLENILRWAVVLNKQRAVGSPWQLQQNLGLLFIGQKCIFCVLSWRAVNAEQHQHFHGDGGIAYCQRKDVNFKQKYDRSPNAAQEARHCYANKYVFQPPAMGMQGWHC